MILGIDLGNFAIKTSTGFDIESKTKLGTGILTTSPLVEYAGKQFILGEGEYCTEYRKVKKENILDLLFSAIVLSTTDINNKIVLGLPVSQFKTDKKELINLVMQNRKMIGVINSIERKIYIDDIEVYPEGVSSAGNEFEGIIIDIGGRTTDVCQVSLINQRRKIDNPFSEALGMINLYSDFIKSINSKYSLDLKLNDAERILKKGLKIKGELIDTSKEKLIFKDYVNKIISKLRVEYPLDTLDITLVGGGATVLGRIFKKNLPQTTIAENSFYANANIFEKVGKQLWQK